RCLTSLCSSACFLNAPPPTNIYTLSLHDALPIYYLPRAVARGDDIEARLQMMVASTMGATAFQRGLGAMHALAHPLGALYDAHQDRKSTRLNSSHVKISYAVFCLKKKKKNQ